MRRAVADLVSLAGRRPGTNVSSLKSRRTHGNAQQQRRHNSTKPDAGPTKGEEGRSTGNANTAPSTPASTATTAAVAAGAATSPMTTVAKNRRSAWEIIKSGPVGRFGEWYTKAQFKRPYVTQVASSVIIYLAGDLSAQLLFPSDDKKKQTATTGGEQKEESSGLAYDPLRTLRHLTVGIISSIPGYKWFMFLHHNFNYASKFLSITTKVAVQQAVFTPVFNTYFFSMQSLLAGASLEETWERLKKALPQSIKNSVKLWPAVTAFSFMYIPPHFRSVFGGSIAVGWQTYLSWLNQKAAREVAAAEAVAAGALQGRVSQAA